VIRCAILSGFIRPHLTAPLASVSMRKSQIQALDREQPVFPMMAPERRTHSYVRHGTTTLFAALDVASGCVIGEMLRRSLCIYMDNYAPTKHPRSNGGSLAGHTIMPTSPRLPRYGSIRSRAGSLN